MKKAAVDEAEKFFSAHYRSMFLENVEFLKARAIDRGALVDQLTAGNALFLFKVVAHHRFIEMQHGFIELGVGDALKR